MLKNDLIIRAAKGEETERVPVWLMRQAGRILKEYREVRASVSGFKELVETPDLAAEVTIQPVDLLGVDAAIIFSDILVIPEAMGLEYQLIEKKGPWFEKTIQSRRDLDALSDEDPDLSYVIDAIKLTKQGLEGRVPLIGFAGAPWTIMCYMTEGSGSKTFSKPRGMMFSEPKLAHDLLRKITKATIFYLKQQIKAGADIVQIFDSWAGILSDEQYQEFGLPYISQICDEISEVPVTVFSKGAFNSLSSLGALNCRTLGLDWQMPAPYVRSLIGDDKTLQGNLDPCVLYADDETIVSETRKMLSSFGRSKHIANLGHGVYPDIHPDKVRLFIETVKNF